jgi:hypothetical protein
MSSPKHRIVPPAVALALLAAATAGCFGVRESGEPMGSDTNNDAGPSADYAQTEVGPGGCIASTTGEPTADEPANPCPQGQVPRSQAG